MVGGLEQRGQPRVTLIFRGMELQYRDFMQREANGSTIFCRQPWVDRADFDDISTPR